MCAKIVSKLFFISSQVCGLLFSNRLASLPGWVGGCSRLRALFASHNDLTAVPQQLLSGQLPHLHTLQLSYNQLQQLPPTSSRLPLALHHLFLQSNRLAALPCNLFTAATRSAIRRYPVRERLFHPLRP